MNIVKSAYPFSCWWKFVASPVSGIPKLLRFECLFHELIGHSYKLFHKVSSNLLLWLTSKIIYYVPLRRSSLHHFLRNHSQIGMTIFKNPPDRFFYRRKYLLIGLVA